jgi:hypothetical protein
VALDKVIVAIWHSRYEPSLRLSPPRKPKAIVILLQFFRQVAVCCFDSPVARPDCPAIHAFSHSEMQRVAPPGLRI